MENLIQNFKLCVSMLFVCTSSFAQEPFSENGMYGFKQNEKIIIPATFEYVTHFSEGLACVKQTGKWGYIDINGKWIIEPQFLTAQPMKNGLAKVKGPNGIGMINTTGEIVVPLEFSTIEKYNTDFDINKDGKIGQLKEGWKMIPPKYQSLEEMGDSLIYAKVNDSSYDLYTKKGLLAENQTLKVAYLSGYRDYACVIEQNGKYGVYSAKNDNWIEQPQYEFIHFLPTSPYQFKDYYEKLIGTNEAHYALVLCRKFGVQYDDIVDFNYKMNNSIMDIKSLDGQVTFCKGITDYSLDDIASNPENLEFTYFIYKDSLIGKINTNLSITEPIYRYIESFGDGEIRQTENKFQYFNDQKKLEIEGDSIKTLRYVYDEYFDDWGEFHDYVFYIAPNVLIIENDSTSFIYNTLSHSAETAKFSSKTNYSIKVEGLNYDGPIITTVEYELDGLMGYTIINEEGSSLMNYSDFFYIPNENITFARTPANNKEILLYYKNPAKIICTADDITHSGAWNIIDNYYNEYEEPFIEEQKLFPLSFYILKDGNKMGVLAHNNKVIVPKYDTLYPYLADSTFIITELNGNFGAINIVTGQVVEPSYNELPEIVKTKYPNRFYTFFPNKTGLQFFGIDSNWYISSYSYFEPVHENDKWFIQMNSEDGDNSVSLFEPRFDYIQETDQYQIFVATSKGKKGLINAFGDTLLPFEYTSIQEGEYDMISENGDVIRTMSIYKKKKQGIFIEGRGVILDAIYDYYDPWTDNSDGRIIGWIAKTKNKFCLLDSLGNTILPPIYAALESADFANNENYILLYDKKYRGLFYKDSVIVPPAYDWVEPVNLYEDNPLGKRAVELHKDGKMGLYISTTNSIIEPFVNDIEYNVHYELLNKAKSMFVINEGNTGVVNMHGEEVMPPIFEDVIFRIEESTGDYPVARGIRNDKAYARAYDLKNQKWMVKLNPNLLFDQINMHEAIVFEKNKISQYNLKTGEIVNTDDSNDFLISTS